MRTKLTQTPSAACEGRKILESLVPEWEHVEPLWQLRVGDYRVFYDVDEAERRVYVRRVLRKGSSTTGDIT